MTEIFEKDIMILSKSPERSCSNAQGLVNVNTMPRNLVQEDVVRLL